jgi:membrane protein DedA with SNARE-associated domain
MSGTWRDPPGSRPRGWRLVDARRAITVSTHRLSLVCLVVVASAAAIVGDNIGYLIGRAGGYRLLRRYGRCVRVDEAKLKVGRCLFDGPGGKVLFCRRFVAALRTYLAFVAGVNLMSWRCFLLYLRRHLRQLELVA